VIFGDHVGDNDRHQEAHRPGGVYGVDLQANFVAAILDKRYYLPLLSPTSNLFFIGSALFVLHICFHRFKWWLTFGIALSVWAFTAIASLLILSYTGYLFTPWVQGLTFATIFVTALHHWTSPGTPNAGHLNISPNPLSTRTTPK
jgi:CHASE2 domain-containing sensor protein